MTDHTSDEFPKDRYEGPMATERRTPAVAPLNARPLSGEDLTAALKVQADLIRDRNEAVRRIYSAPTHDSGATVSATDEIEKWKDQLAIVLKERNDFESGFAAMTKERDGLAATLKQAVADCNEARAEVERLKGEVRELKIKCEQRRRDCVEFAGELRVAEEDERVARDENAALRARIAALEAVVAAQTAYNTAALNLRDAWDAAGLDAGVVEKARITEEK